MQNKKQHVKVEKNKIKTNKKQRKNINHKMQQNSINRATTKYLHIKKKKSQTKMKQNAKQKAKTNNNNNNNNNNRTKQLSTNKVKKKTFFFCMLIPCFCFI